MTMVPIASWTANGSSNPTFLNIPQTYKHLQLRVFLRGTRSGYQNGDLSYIRLNGDYGNNYSGHWLLADGASAMSGYNNSVGFAYLGNNTSPDGSTLANVYGSQIIDILDYSNASKNTTVRMLAGWDANGYGYVSLVSGCWYNTAAITQIDGLGSANSYMAVGSRVDLYGIL